MLTDLQQVAGLALRLTFKRVEIVDDEPKEIETKIWLLPYTLLDIAEVEEKYGSLDALSEQSQKTSTVKYFLWLAARGTHPDLTEDDLARLIDGGDIPRLEEAISSLLPKARGVEVGVEIESPIGS